MEWLVHIIGNNSDLEELSKSLNSPELCVTQEGENFFLKSTYFNSFKEADDVRKKASEILPLINGSAMLAIEIKEPLKVGIIRKDHKNGTSEVFIVGSGSIVMGGSAHVEVIEPDGTIKEIRPADPIPNYFQKGLNDNNVAKVLQFLGTGKIDWRILYNIYDAIMEDVGGYNNLLNKGWAPKESIKLFHHTPQSWDAVGVDARHGKHIPAPDKPMSISEAKSLIKNITIKWLQTK